MLRYLRINVILSLAATLRVCSIFIIRSYFHPVTWEFGFIARFIVQGHGFSYGGPHMPSAFMPPGYPLLLAAMIYAFGDTPLAFLLLALLQAAFGVLLVYLVYLLTFEIYGFESIACASAALAALYPPLVYMCNEFHSISFYIVLSAGTVLFLVRAIKHSGEWRNVIYAALMMGLLLLFRAEALALALVFALLLLRVNERFSLARPAVFLAISLACLSPWVLRNYHVFHHFVPTTTTAGLNLWIGNNPHASGSDRGDSKYVPPALQAQLAAVPVNAELELTQSRILTHAALLYIATHPKREIGLACRKLFDLWVFDPLHEKGRRPAYWVPSVLLSLLAAVGLFLGPKVPPGQLAPVLLSIACSVGVAIVFFALPRYKIVMDPFLCMFAAAALTGLFPKLSGRHFFQD